MEQGKKFHEQINIKSTINLVNKFEKLNDVSDYFKKAFPENWKNYLNLYNKCFIKLSDKKANYIKNIEEFEKIHDSVERNNGSFLEYEKALTGNIVYCDKIIKELFSKIIDKVGHNTLLVNYANKLSEVHSKNKREIAEKVGILTQKSINRNILQSSNNSPLKKLEQLYNSLQNDNDDFTIEKNLLEITKELDIKVENSLQKVFDCKFGEYTNVGENFISHLSEANSDVKKELNVLDEFAEKRKKMLKTKIEFNKTEKYSKEFLELIEETRDKIIVSIGNRAKKNKSFEDRDKKLIEFYAKILGLKISLMELI